MVVVGSNQYQQLHNWQQSWDPTNTHLVAVVGSNQYQQLHIDGSCRIQPISTTTQFVAVVGPNNYTIDGSSVQFSNYTIDGSGSNQYGSGVIQKLHNWCSCGIQPIPTTRHENGLIQICRNILGKANFPEIRKILMPQLVAVVGSNQYQQLHN